MAAPLTDRRIDHIVVADVTTASGAQTVNETAVELPHIPNGVIFVIDLTAAATAVGDTLNITIQTQIGATWTAVYQSTQFLGNGGAKLECSDKILAAGAEGQDAAFPSTLAANAHANFIGHRWRVRYVQVDADAANASFTFTVTATIM